MSENTGVRSFLDGSSAHLTSKDADLISSGVRSNNTGRVISHEYGWFIHVALDDTEEQDEGYRDAGFSESFIALLAYARTHNCWWINLDQDADVIPGLATYSW